jgi:prepilin-type N-terminal cleavage/methylation domain-containing protein
MSIAEDATVRRGFTLLEVMIVVAIIGLVMALAGNATQTSQRRARMHEAARQFRSRLEHARTLSIAAGPLLGTAQFVNCFGGGGPPGPSLLVVIDPANNAYQVPTGLAFAGAVLRSNCLTVQVAGASESRQTATITVNGGAALTQLAFTPNGRLDPVISPGPIFIRFEDAGGGEAERGYGFRILPSGVICTASGPAGAACDEDI